MIFQI